MRGWFLLSCSVAIHVLTGSGRLRTRAARIAVDVRSAADACLERLRLTGDIDIVVRDDPRWAIPELGIGGHAPDAHTIFVALDPENERFETALERDYSGRWLTSSTTSRVARSTR